MTAFVLFMILLAYKIFVMKGILTMDMYKSLGLVAGVLSLVGYIPYIISIIKGKTRPNKSTWFIWTVVGGLLAFSYAAEGDPQTIWLPLGYFFGPLITAILSIRYGDANWSRFDIICLSVAIISVIPWVLSKNATFTLLINVLIDMAGALPTLVKTYHEPETEDLTAWFIFFIANTIQLFAISYWNIAAIYPIYLFFLAGFIVFLVLKGKIGKKSSHT
jgi:uncharacterized protein with PQ loop repeat